MIEFFDSHCHLTDTAFRDDREAVLLRAREAGVTRLVTIATDVADSGRALELAAGLGGSAAVEGAPPGETPAARGRGVKSPSLWCTVGVHPHEAGAAAPDALGRIRELAARPEVVALGETGLDYHYDHGPRDVQRRLFEAHLALGAELGLPVVVHSREADDDVAAILRAAQPGTLGVLHCFTGGDQAFEEAMLRGWYVSFSGVASFKTFGAVARLREVPADRLLVETDSPYLAPVPLRGKRNEPAFVRHVAEAVAAHVGDRLEAVAARTTANAVRFYRLDE